MNLGMDFAIIRHLGKQHLVTVGSKIEVNGIGGNIGDTITLSDVLLVSKDDTVEVGAPVLSGKSVIAQIEDAGKGEKIRVAKFKAKSRYRKVMGFRPLITGLRIVSLGESVSKTTPKAEKETSPKPAAKKTVKKPVSK